MHRLIKQSSRSYAAALILGVVFFFAQAIVLVHDLDPKTYEVDHVCEVCLPASVLGGGNVAAALSIEITPVNDSIEPAADVALISTPYRRAHARDPPAIS